METPRQNRQNEINQVSRLSIEIETLKLWTRSVGLEIVALWMKAPKRKALNSMNKSFRRGKLRELLEAAIRSRRSALLNLVLEVCLVWRMYTCRPQAVPRLLVFLHTHCITWSLFSDWISPFAPAVLGEHGNLGSLCQLFALHWFLSTTQFAEPVTGGGGQGIHWSLPLVPH